MSLLTEIQAAAVDPNADVSTLLRKCKILAARLGNREFKTWVDNELNGYGETAELPSYRVLHTESYGHFSGFFRSERRGLRIPLSCVPEKYGEWVTVSRLRAPISNYAALINPSERSDAQEQWPMDMVRALGERIYEGWTCVDAWKLIPYNSLVALVDTVRTRVLSFALEIEREAPDAGEAPINAPPLTQEKVSQVFNTNITGNVQNVSAGGGHVTQIGQVVTVAPGDFKSLRAFLASSSVDEADIVELETAIRQDSEVHGNPAFGQRVQAWTGKMFGKAASGAWTVTTSAAGTVLGKALSKYFGLE